MYRDVAQFDSAEEKVTKRHVFWEVAPEVRNKPKMKTEYTGMWRSLVAHLAWDEGVARSNRVIPTI